MVRHEQCRKWSLVVDKDSFQPDSLCKLCWSTPDVRDESSSDSSSTDSEEEKAKATKAAEGWEDTEEGWGRSAWPDAETAEFVEAEEFNQGQGRDRSFDGLPEGPA